MVKRYKIRELSAPSDLATLDAVYRNAECVLAFDYDAMDAAATALGTHVQFLEARIRTLEAELAEAKRQLSLSGSARIAMLSARIEKLETALRYWFPDETLIPEGHEVAWNEHVQLIPEHRLTAETAAESFKRLQREQGIRSGSVTDGKVPQ